MSDQTRLTLYEQGLKAIEDTKEPWGFINSELFSQVLGAMADLQLHNERLARNSIEQWDIGAIRTFIDTLEEMGQAMGGEYADPPDNVVFTVNELKTAFHSALGDLLDDKSGIDQSKLGKLPLGSCHCPICTNEESDRSAVAIGNDPLTVTFPDPFLPWVGERLYGTRTDKPGCRLVPGFYVWNKVTGERRFIGRFTHDTSLHSIEKLACEALIARQADLIVELNSLKLEQVSPGRLR